MNMGIISGYPCSFRQQVWRCSISGAARRAAGTSSPSTWMKWRSWSLPRRGAESRAIRMSDTDLLTQTVDQFCEYLGSLPAEQTRHQAWGAREVLAHLVFHHELYVRLAEADLAKQPVIPLQGRFREINAKAVEENRKFSVQDLIARLKNANQRLVDIYQQNDPNQIVIVIKAGSKPYQLAELVPAVEAHIRNHLVKLRKNMK
jgi:Mycothiol maleylpyruvate isomerase N-terminal domain